MKPTLFLYLFAVALLGIYSTYVILLPCSWLYPTFLFILLAFLPYRFLQSIGLLGSTFFFLGYLFLHHQHRYEQQLKALTPTKKIYSGYLTSIRQHLDGRQTGLLETHEGLFRIGFYDQAATLSLSPGEFLYIRARAKPFPKKLLPGGFDGYGYGFSKNILGQISVSQPKNIFQTRVLPPFQAGITRLKEKWKRVFMGFLSPKECALIFAIVFGETSLFTPGDEQLYRSLGAWHLLAVSGLQVSLFSSFLFIILQSLFMLIPAAFIRYNSAPVTSFLCIILIWFYIALCEFPPSAVRAGLMSSILLFGFFIKRPIHPLDAFGMAGLVTLLSWPQSALDLSFLLSYACVFGLLLAPLPSKWPFKWLQHPMLALLFQVVSATLCAGILALPITAYGFGEINLSGFFTNLILVPLASFLQFPTLLFAFFTVLLDSAFCAKWAFYSMHLLEALCQILQQWVGHLRVVSPPAGFDVFWLFVGFILLISSLYPLQKIKLLFGASCLFLGGFSYYESPQSSQMRVSFLPVGHGDATLIQLPGPFYILVDAGPKTHYTDAGERIILPYLKRIGVQAIDLVILSHSDSDHMGGLKAISKEIPIKRLWHSGFQEIQNQFSFIPSEIPQTNQIYKIKNTTIDILWPKAFDKAQKDNHNSLVFRICHKKTCILFMGDLEKEQEIKLLQKIPRHLLKAAILKVGHHGSKTSSSLEFLQAVKPTHAIISSDLYNRFGFPHESTLENLKTVKAQIWHTGKNGLTEFFIHQNELRIKHF